nr:glycerol kinase 5 [Hymenolepis microstoma]
MISHYQLTCIFSVTRLAHMFQEDPTLYEKCRNGELVYGCLETWLLWRLTGGQAWCTDASCTSASGAFDPSILGLSPVVLNFLKISPKIFPPICPTCTFFGEVRCGPLADIGNYPSKSSPRRVRVTALIGDSQAGMLGEGCLNVGDAKLTLGTGSFLCVNIGSALVPPNTGFYPVVGWSKSTLTDESLSCEDVPDIKLEDVTFLLEGFNSDAGNSLVKLKEVGFFDSYSELEDTLKSITASFDATLDGSSYFIPSSLGLRSSSTKFLLRMENFEKALSFVNTNTSLIDGGIFVGLPLKEKGQMCLTESLKRAALFALMDSLVMAARLLFVKGVNKELTSEIKVLRVNGNLTRSDWLMQRLADTLNLPVERSSTSETCCLGAAIAAGVGAGIWETYDDAVQLLRASRTRFEPIPSSVLRMQRRYLYWTGVCAKVIVAHDSRFCEFGEVIALNDLVCLAL